MNNVPEAFDNDSDNGSLSPESLAPSGSRGSTTIKTSENILVSRALQSYFCQLTLERNINCKNVTVVVDNAHIPLDDEHIFSDQDIRKEALSQSLSALNTISFPPAFLTQNDGNMSSRWDSVEIKGASQRVCNESDFRLQKPSRTHDDNEELASQSMDRTMHNKFPGSAASPVLRKRTIRRPAIFPGSAAYKKYAAPRQSSSLDSTARWLRELPRIQDLKPSPPSHQSRCRIRHSPSLSTTPLPMMQPCVAECDVNVYVSTLEELDKVPCTKAMDAGRNRQVDPLILMMQGTANDSPIKHMENIDDSNPAEEEGPSTSSDDEVLARSRGSPGGEADLSLKEPSCSMPRWDQMIALRSSLSSRGLSQLSIVNGYPFSMCSNSRSQDFATSCSLDSACSRKYLLKDLAVVQEHDDVERIIESTGRVLVDYR